MLSWATSRYAKIESIYKKILSMILKFCLVPLKALGFVWLGYHKANVLSDKFFCGFFSHTFYLEKQKILWICLECLLDHKVIKKLPCLFDIICIFWTPVCWFIFYKNFVFVEFSYHKRKSVGLRLMGSQD